MYYSTNTSTNSLEESIFEVALALLDLDELCTSPTKQQNSTQQLHICPVPGCGRQVRCLWNHLHQYHKNKGLTGKSICCLYCKVYSCLFRIISDEQLARHTKKRRQWSRDELEALQDEMEIVPHMPVPSRKWCEKVLKYHERGIFKDKTSNRDDWLV